MRKTYIVADENRRESQPPSARYTADEIAAVAVSSEAEGFPVEDLFEEGAVGGWRAGVSGKQIIRVTFSEPVPVRRIDLLFREAAAERTQEFTLSWIDAENRRSREIVRQQWNFSPFGSNEEQETFHVQLSNVLELELTIMPDIAGGSAIASLQQFVISR